MLLYWISLFPLVFSQAPASECVSIKTTSICEPWSGRDLSINVKQLSAAYGLKQGETLDAAKWERLVETTTSGGENQRKLWDNWLQCPGYKGELLQYYRSYICMSDLFVLSAGCNSAMEDLTPMCPEVCQNYGEAISTLVQSPSSCPQDLDRFPSEVAKQVTQSRQTAMKGVESCNKIIKSSQFNAKEQCITGIKSDQESCGFGGNTNVAKLYCEKNKGAACCSSLKVDASSQVQQSFIAPIEKFAMMWDASVGTNAQLKEGNQGRAVATVIIVAACFVGIAAAGFTYYRKKTYSRTVPLKPSDPLLSTRRDLDVARSEYDGKLVCKVKFDYSANLSDEMNLSIDDIIVFDKVSDDGWGDARNLTTGEVGKACTRFMNPINY